MFSIFMMNSRGAANAVAPKKRMGLVKDLAFSILCSLVILPVQYLNSVLEQDHRAIKRRVRASPLHSRNVRGDELSFRSSTPTFGSTTKLQHTSVRLLYLLFFTGRLILL